MTEDRIGFQEARQTRADRSRAAEAGQSLYAWRSNAGLSRAEAAGRIGVSPAFVRTFEMGMIDPGEIKPSLAVTIMRATGLTAHALHFDAQADADLMFPPIAHADDPDVVEVAIAPGKTCADPVTVRLGFQGAPSDRILLSLGHDKDAIGTYLHPDFADALALNLIRLAVTARATLKPQGD